MAAANPPISAVPALPRLGARSLLHGLDYQWQVLICAVVGVFMVMLDQTVVNIALPKITTVFGVGVHETQLIVTSYMLALAVIMPAMVIMYSRLVPNVSERYPVAGMMTANASM